MQNAVAAIDAAVLAEMERCHQPGLTVGVTDADQTLYVGTYGFADLTSQESVTAETLFEIGSIGKSFTAVAILQLVDEGLIDLHAPVDRYLPWFRVSEHEDTSPITVAHLLSHTAGIVAGIDGTPEAAFQVWTLRDLPRFSPPGERFHYSNVGYKALGLVLEAVAGRPYHEVLRERILDPLGMAATEPAITHAIRPRLAVGYVYLDDNRMGHAGVPLVPATWLETETADGSIASTATDMCSFVRALLRGGKTPAGELLSKQAFEQMTTGHATDEEGGEYGYGLSLRALNGHRFIGHGGGMVGYAAGIETEPDTGLGAIVLQNAARTSPMALARLVIEIVRKARDGATLSSVASSPISIAPAPEGLAGTYLSADTACDPIEIVPDEGLRLRLGGREIALEALEDDLFLAPDEALDRFPLRVEHPTDGAPEVWHASHRYVLVGAAARPLPAPPDELRAIAGQYRSHNPWTTNFHVFLRGDRPWLYFADPPDGFAVEQQLVQQPDSSFRVGEDAGNPEVLRFDTIVDRRALRAWLSGWPYYRVARSD